MGGLPRGPGETAIGKLLLANLAADREYIEGELGGVLVLLYC